ncbi:Uu.00g003340.m01.CDS01 [Anthostomella pinea]|uniref:Uu.00g003340.m01.CDS01 n=1 Tax=Anthostomella pinea TaxID=933095 RepID=A0AAI8VJN3_9PEZI|nr:Uu.00g003340.m01.CDS01 [Anthostomella pinea]
MERRRLQNRIAQRRFRQKQQQKAAEQAQANAPPTSSHHEITELHYEVKLPLSHDPTPEFPPPATTPRSVSSPAAGRSLCDLSAYGSLALLDNISFANMDNLDMSAIQMHGTRDDLVEMFLSRLGCKESMPTDSGVDSEGQAGWVSALHIAAQKGHDRVARALLQHNAEGNVKDSDGKTPLIHATIGGHKEVVSLLLTHGARIGNVDNEHRSALHWAVVHRRETLLKLLLDHAAGDLATIDGYDDSGRTPLHMAVDMDFEAGLQLLLEFGANVHYKARSQRQNDGLPGTS